MLCKFLVFYSCFCSTDSVLHFSSPDHPPYEKEDDVRIEAIEDDSEAEGSSGELDIKELRAKKQALARKVAEQQRRQDKIQVGLGGMSCAVRTHSRLRWAVATGRGGGDVPIGDWTNVGLCGKEGGKNTFAKTFARETIFWGGEKWNSTMHQH